MNTQLQRMRDALVEAGFSRQAAEEALQERMTIRDQVAIAVLPGLVSRANRPNHIAVDDALKIADDYLAARIPK